MPNEHNFTQGKNPLLWDNDKYWAAADPQSSEKEVRDFLRGLIYLIKPRFIIETGCFAGLATVEMAAALRENGVGRLIACDIDPDRVKETNTNLEQCGLFDAKNGAVAIQTRGVDLIKQCKGIVDFAFIDSAPTGKERLEEAEELIKHLKPFDMFCIHDTAPHKESIYTAIKKIKLPSVYLNCPRGLTLFQRV